ncbi:MAG: DUF1893 domain-containing protein [Dehalococcoidia bacterium]|nr:DUF1893 domain-containing protein [Dehalococcoidia bacterium]
MNSQDTFRVYKGSRLLFASRKDKLAPMVDYIENCAPFVEGVTVYDRIVGNAAALLLITINCRTVFSALGSENAIKTLAAAGIKYRFNETIDCIMNDPGTDMCPMEKLSLGKAPDEFFRALKARIVASSK